jgi:hypothetical protein
MSDHPPLHTERVIEVLDRHAVRYLLIGGVAGLLHGAQRPTLDLDLLPRSDAENLDRLAAALVEMGAYLRVGGLSDEEARSLPMMIDSRSLRDMEVSTWRTTEGDIDVLRHLRNEGGERLGYDELSDRSLTIKVVGIDVRLAGLRDIVASKRFAGRDKDREALPELERLLDAEAE